MFNHNIGGSSPLNTIQRQLGVTVQCYDTYRSDSEESIDVRDEPRYYCPTSDVSVCDRNDQVCPNCPHRVQVHCQGYLSVVPMHIVYKRKQIYFNIIPCADLERVTALATTINFEKKIE